MKNVSHLPPDPEYPGAVIGWGVVNDAQGKFLDIFATWPEARDEIKSLGEGHSAHLGSYRPEKDEFFYHLPVIQR